MARKRKGGWKRLNDRYSRSLQLQAHHRKGSRRKSSKWSRATMRSAKRVMQAYDSRNPGAKEAICTAPHKFYQWRYKMGFARVRCQHFENTANAKAPKWRHLKTYQMPKATANRQIQNLTELDWKIKTTY